MHFQMAISITYDIYYLAIYLFNINVFINLYGRYNNIKSHMLSHIHIHSIHMFYLYIYKYIL